MVKAFVSGRMSYDNLIQKLKGTVAQSAAHAADVHSTLSGAVEAGRLPNDLAQIIRNQLPAASSGAGDRVLQATAPAEPVPIPLLDEDDDLDAPTIPHGVHAQAAPQLAPEAPTQSPYLPPLPYLTSPPGAAGDDMRDKVDDVVLGSLVDSFRDFRKARTGDAAPAAQTRPEQVDQFLTGFKSARIRSDARKAAAGRSTVTSASSNLGQSGRERAGVGSLLRDRFVLDHEIGRGAMGVVYAAVDRRRLEAGHGEPYVALKLLSDEVHSDAGALRQLEAEARKAQMLAHPNIATVYDFDRDGGEVFIVMELLKGTTLDRKLSAALGRSLPAKEALPILEGICSGLVYAHSQNVVHSDLKPGNVFVLDGYTVKLLDFGLAAATAADMSGDSLAGGLTASYASLEMFEGAARDPRDDVYALGCIVYQILAGRHPFSMKASDEAVREGLAPEPLEGLEPKVWDALVRALAFRREDRLESISLFQDALFG